MSAAAKIPSNTRPVLKTRPLNNAQAGHTLLEQAIYLHLWRLGGGDPQSDEYCEAPGGHNTIARHFFVTDKTAKRALRGLEDKLSIEPIPGSFVASSAAEPKAKPLRYRIYSFKSIVARRKKAGLARYIRNRAGGVTLMPEGRGEPASGAALATAPYGHRDPTPMVTVTPPPMVTVTPPLRELSLENSLRETPSDGRSVITLEEPSVRPSDDWLSKSFRKTRIRNYLVRNFANPLPPDDVVLDPLSDLILNKLAFEQFQHACKTVTPKKGWKVFVKVAQNCNKNPTYQQAKTKQQQQAEINDLPSWADSEWAEQMRKGGMR